jgi:hypothetical protein
MGILQDVTEAWEHYKADAMVAYRLFTTWCEPMPRRPGMSTPSALAYRISLGRSVEEAAAREYLYRWALAIKPGDQVTLGGMRNEAASVFGAPHTIGL